jgi:chromosome segregation ATPase
MKKFDSSNHSNMEDIMKINEVLKPYQERVNFDATGDNILDNCVNIENKFRDLDDISHEMKEFEQNLNKAIELMTSECFESFDKSYNEFNPELLTRYKELKNSIKEQKDENSNLIKQIDHLNQEIHQIFENMVKLQARLDVLEGVCGLEMEQASFEDDASDG